MVECGRELCNAIPLTVGPKGGLVTWCGENAEVGATQLCRSSCSPTVCTRALLLRSLYPGRATATMARVARLAPGPARAAMLLPRLGRAAGELTHNWDL